MTKSYTETETLSKMTCGECGILFAVPLSWREDKQKTGQGFCCPNGHRRVFRETLETKLQRELEWEKKQRTWAEESRARTEKELEHQKFKTMAERSAKVRLKKRIANGVCPCCQRSFENLHKHMAHMHPGFQEAEKDEVLTASASATKHRGRPLGSKNKRGKR